MPNVAAVREWNKWQAEKSLPFSGQGGGGLQVVFDWELFKAFKRDPILVPPWENGTVLSCLRWLWRTFPEAPMQVYRSTRSGNPEIMPRHAMTRLVSNPNEFYSGRLLWSATLLSFAIDGNAYWHKERGRTGRVIKLWWIPHQLISPAWDREGKNFITHYEYRVNFDHIKIPSEDIVHFRDGLDPLNPRKGLSPLKAVIREVLTDNEAAQYTYAVLRNGGVMNLVVTPKDINQTFSEKTRRELERQLQSYTGDGRGKAMVLSGPVTMEAPKMIPPEQLALDKLRSIPSTRICSVFGFDPMLLGLPSENKTYSNMKEAREAAYESYVIPMQGSMGEVLNRQLLFDVGMRGREGQFVQFDTREIRVLQEDAERRYRRVTDAFIGGVLKRGEARELLGFKSTDDEDDQYYTDIEGEANQRLRAEMLPARDGNRDGARARD